VEVDGGQGKTGCRRLATKSWDIRNKFTFGGGKYVVKIKVLVILGKYHEKKPWWSRKSSCLLRYLLLTDLHTSPHLKLHNSRSNNLDYCSEYLIKNENSC
jgi:hypothetical protein